MQVVLALGLLLVSFYLLAVICEEYFVPSLDIISHRLKLSSDVAGATFMAVGSSAPELFTSVFALLHPGEASNVGAGTIVGSAIFNVLVIIGAAAAFKTVKLNWQPVVRDTAFYVITILLLLWSFWDGRVEFFEALIFVVVYAIYILAVVKWRKIFPYKDVDPIHELEEGSSKNKLASFSKQILGILIPDCTKRPNLYLATFGISITLIALLSHGLVESVVVISNALQINATFLALTVLAAGTSIPDLISSVVVAKQGRGDMAVSNAVGSNVFDILFGLGVPWLFAIGLMGRTILVNTENLLSSIFLLFATVIAIFFLLVVRRWKIGQRAGLGLIGLYVLYIVYTFLQVK